MSPPVSKFSISRKILLAFAATLVVLPLAACDTVSNLGKPDKGRQQDLELKDFSSDMHWGDFDAAYDFVDPKTKAEHPLSDLDKQRFKQVEVSGYQVTAKLEHDGILDQQVQLDLINRNTQVPRSVSYHEQWRWDDTEKRWWLVSGLPDISPQY